MLRIIQIYSSQEAEIWQGGCKSRKFLIYRGVHQGCPLSPLLCNIMIEMLAIAVWQQKEVVGIQTQFTGHKICLYADDAVFWLQNRVSSLKVFKAKAVLHRFGKVSGYKVNESKSVILGMNIDKKMKKQIRSFASTAWQRTVKYLGV